MAFPRAAYLSLTPARASARRVLLMLAATAILHLFALQAVSPHLGLPPLRAERDAVVTARLVAAPVPPPRPAAAPKKKRGAPAVAASRPVPAMRASSEPIRTEPIPWNDVAPETAASDPLPAEPSPAPTEAAEIEPKVSAEERGNQATAEAAAAEAALSDLEEASPHAHLAVVEKQAEYAVNLPPSVELEYDVEALAKGLTYYGSGKISWQLQGSDYQITGRAKVAFFTVLDFHSEGTIDGSGIAPVLYAEKPRNKSETNTHFNRERQVISFSASTRSYPREGGEQDRASVLLQLAGIGRGDGTKFAPDAELQIFVAGTRDAEAWRIRVIGVEEVETAAGKVLAWHLLRVPRANAYERKLDLWLAPSMEWYPVKLRYTERNGDYLELLLTQMTPLAPKTEQTLTSNFSHHR